MGYGGYDTAFQLINSDDFGGEWRRRREQDAELRRALPVDCECRLPRCYGDSRCAAASAAAARRDLPPLAFALPTEATARALRVRENAALEPAIVAYLLRSVDNLRRPPMEVSDVKKRRQIDVIDGPARPRR